VPWRFVVNLDGQERRIAKTNFPLIKRIFLWFHSLKFSPNCKNNLFLSFGTIHFCCLLVFCKLVHLYCCILASNWICRKPKIASRFQAPWHDWIGSEQGTLRRKIVTRFNYFLTKFPLKGTSHSGYLEEIAARLVKIVTRFWAAVTSI